MLLDAPLTLTGPTYTIDTTADAAPTATVTIIDGDGYVSASEAGSVSYTVAGVDMDATATVTFSGLDKVTGLATILAGNGVNGPHTIDLSGSRTAPCGVDLAERPGGQQRRRHRDTTTLDPTPPTLTPVADQTDEATGPNGAVATFAATATDLVDGTDAVVFKEGGNVVHSGSTFGLGIHTITASATDAAGNTASESFRITVQDTTPPVLTAVANQTDEATGPSGAAATFAATATDLVDGTDPVVFKEGGNVVHSGDTFASAATPSRRARPMPTAIRPPRASPSRCRTPRRRC